jgi:alpha-L-rhamnosidase
MTPASTVWCADLRSERRREPIGLGTPTPRLSWRLDVREGTADVVQLASQVEVDGLWDSGRVEGWRQQVTYDGPALASCASTRWRVRAWTSAGVTSWSEWATFETGILDPAEWEAAMITADVAGPVARFARTVVVPDDVSRARLRLTGHGIVVAAIDGVDVGDEVLAPGWTSYHRRLAVRTFDVTSQLHAGEVELSAMVAPGWYSGRIGFDGGRQVYGTQVGLFAQLEIDHDKGRIVVGTDESWSATETPYTGAEIYDGETYDAREPLVGRPGRVSVDDGFDVGVLFAPAVPPVRRTATRTATATTGGVLDFGQNLVGWLRITLRGVPAGTEVVLRHAEVLDAEGRLFTAPLRTAAATDTYITAGGDVEVYEPRFTFHGFRYAEVGGVDLDQLDVVAVVVHSELEAIGSFSCSDPLLDRLHENVVWGQRGNFVSLPTDCPQRDERLGWTGDAQVFSPTASFLYDCETFWEHWLADLAADQLPDGSVTHVVPAVPLLGGVAAGAAGWGDAAVVVPWTTYVAYGDDKVLRDALPSMRAWVDFVFSRLDAEHRWVQDFQFGDWLDPDAPTDQPWRAKARYDLVATAYAAWSASLLARVATVVGEAAVAATAAERAASVREAWWDHFGAMAATTQTGAALAIAFELAPDAGARIDLGEALVQRVRDADDHLSTGFLGTPALLPALTQTGHLDVAYRVLLQRTSPSWLSQVLAGATTIWERWDARRADGSVPLDSLEIGSGTSMVSFNHYAYGAVADWLHTTVAGLRPDPDEPGYHHFFVEPRPGGGLTHASASRRTRFGTASVAWRIDDDGELHLDVGVPPNTSATIVLPGHAPARVGSGSHHLVGDGLVGGRGTGQETDHPSVS